jgi:hypothetical protein
MLTFQWLALGALLAVIKWGHIWRQRTNLKQGILTVDDDRQTAPGVPEENGDVEKSPGVQPAIPIPQEQDEEAKDSHGDMPLETRRLARRNSTLPPVRDVLKRTTSLSQASVHGG